MSFVFSSVFLSGLRLCAAQGAPPPSSEDKIFAKTKSLVAAKKYAEAEGMLASLISQGALPARVYFLVGKTYFEADEWQHAADNLEKSLQAQEGNDQTHLLLGLAYRELKVKR